MWWANPLWLFAVLLAIPMARLSRTRGETRRAGGQARLHRLALLRTVEIVLLALALAGPSVLLPSHRRYVGILLDVSASMGQVQIEQARRAALSAIGHLQPQDRVAVAAFAGRVRVLTPPVAPEEAAALLESAELQADQPGRSDLRAAIRTGADLLSGQRGNRYLLLFSDGRPTTGGAVAAGGLPVYTVPLGTPGADLVTQNLVIPERARAGERVALKWEVHAGEAQAVNATVSVNGSVLQRRILRVPAGPSVVPWVVQAPEPGVHRVEIAAVDERGRPLPLAAAGGLLTVSGAARVLVVRGGAGGAAIPPALATQGFEVRERRASVLPEAANNFSGYTAVVLDNVPAYDLSESQQEAIGGFVADGGGLLVVGGDTSLGRGEYFSSKLEELLPVQTDSRQRLFFTRAYVLFIIDHSGSMSEMVGETSKQLAAMRGVVAATRELSPQDEVGILGFSEQPTWVLPFTPVTQQAEIHNALSRIGQGGGTDMATALQEAVRGFSDRGPARRHVVVLSDGLTLKADFAVICRRLKAMGATITTIAVGNEINERLLREIAGWGGGRYYRAKLDEIPRVILRETIRVSRDLIQEGRFAAVVRTPADLLDGLDRGTPPILGYLVTKAKKPATVYLEIGKSDPLLAVWRYGSGRVAVFTSDSGRRWLGPWSGSPSYNRLWSQVLRAIERGPMDPGLAVRVQAAAGTAKVVVEATGPDRRLRSGLDLVGRQGTGAGSSFRLRETAPGRYEAEVLLAKTGLQEFLVREEQGNTWATGWVWNPPGAEAKGPGPDLALLSQLAAASGGRMLSLEDPRLPGSGWTWEPIRLQIWLALLALAVFLVELCYRSTSLGQFSVARQALAVWWKAQARLLDVARGSGKDRAGKG